MCEVRAAAAHQAVQAAGPMWRKERSGFRHTGKGLCEGGAKKAKTFYKHEPEQKPFSFFKLTNNKKILVVLELIAERG